MRIGAGAVLAGLSMILSLAVNLSDVSNRERSSLHYVLVAMTLMTIGLLGWPLLRTSIAQFARRRVPFEGLFLVAILGALGASIGSMQSPSGDVYFEVISVLLVIYAFGQEIARRGRDSIVHSIERWLPADATCTRVAADGHVERVSVNEVQRGDVLRVQPGEVIAVEGTITRGRAFLAEAEITGEHFVASKSIGSSVHAGTRPVDGTIDIRATSTAHSSQIERIIEAVNGARRRKAPIERQVDRLAAYLLPIVLVAGTTTFVAWSLLDSIGEAIFNATAVLLIACPCAMGFATPIAIWAALSRLASMGMIAQGGDTIESLANIDVAIFDKTGTLTENRTELVELLVDPKSHLNASFVRDLTIAVQRGSDHPVATALAQLVPSGKHGSMSLEHVRILPGIGIEGMVRVQATGTRHFVRIGEAEHLVDNAHEWTSLCNQLAHAGRSRKLAIVIDRQLAGVAAVEETLRRTTHAALAQLRGMGIETIVLTGDAFERAANLPANQVAARQSPDDKLARVQTLQADGHRILFVGDGMNDLPALARSDVSIAVEAATSLAIANSDVIWYGNDLRTIPESIRTCRTALRMIRSNLVIAGIYNTIGIIAASLGFIHPILAVLLMTVSSLTVSFRAATISNEATMKAPLRGSLPMSVAQPQRRGISSSGHALPVEVAGLSREREAVSGSRVDEQWS